MVGAETRHRTVAVQLATLPWLGFVPDEASVAPPVATARTSATALTWEKVAHLLTDQLRADLDSVGRRSTSRALERREPQRLYAILLAVVTQSAIDQVGEVVMLFDQAFLPVLAEPAIPDGSRSAGCCATRSG
ncbi:hypothetical protein [Nonomuraea sp. NPDC050786]|uniref:hypothetical protein n=1 Tax=Nonomuraea sp. NPDC050786 TaxID=3154840 RepID=UPI0033FBA635